MGDKTATFTVDLKDGTSGAANAAADSLVKLKSKIDQDVKALREMQKAMKQLQGGSAVSVKAFRDLQAKIDATKNSIAEGREGFISLGGTFGKRIAPQAAKAGDAIGGFTTSLQSAGGPLAAVGGRLSKLAALLSNPIAILAALAAAFVAVSAAIGVATIALAKWALTASDSRRNEALQIEGLNTLRQRWGMATASVADYQAAIDRASDSTNVGRDTLQGYARQLARTGLAGEELTQAVEAMGIAAMVQGERGAQRFRALAFQARLTGGSVADLAEAYRNRLGPIARRQMLSLDNQTERFRKNLDRLFDGVAIEGFLSALDEVLSLFSQTTATGRALKSIIEILFTPLGGQVAVVGPLIKRFFQGVVIVALLLTIAFLRVRNALRDAFEGSGIFENIDATKLAVKAGTVAVFGFVAVVFALAAAFALVVGFMAIFAATALAIPLALGAIAVGLVGLVTEAAEFWADFDFAELGRNMVDGIIEGLTEGDFANAVFDLANDVTDSFKSALGIASPSRVFAGFGLNIAQGLSRGIESGAPGVEDSVGGLVDTPTGGGVGSSASITIGDVMINAAETSNPRELAMQFRDELASVLEGVAIELGTATP